MGKFFVPVPTFEPSEVTSAESPSIPTLFASQTVQLGEDLNFTNARNRKESLLKVRGRFLFNYSAGFGPEAILIDHVSVIELRTEKNFSSFRGIRTSGSVHNALVA